MTPLSGDPSGARLLRRQTIPHFESFVRPCRSATNAVRTAPYLRPAPELPVAGLRRARRDHHDPRCPGDWYLNLRDLPGRRRFCGSGLVERLRLLQPPPAEAPSEDRSLWPETGVRH